MADDALADAAQAVLDADASFSMRQGLVRKLDLRDEVSRGRIVGSETVDVVLRTASARKVSQMSWPTRLVLGWFLNHEQPVAHRFDLPLAMLQRLAAASGDASPVADTPTTHTYDVPFSGALAGTMLGAGQRGTPGAPAVTAAVDASDGWITRVVWPIVTPDKPVLYRAIHYAREARRPPGAP